SSPIILDSKKVKNIFNQSLNFKLRFSYNLQTMAMHRDLVQSLKNEGQFFYSPYPDYYAITVLLKKAKRILASPYPLTTVGICPKSFGASYINNQEDVGMETLNVGKESEQY